jgi:hypothetical protein
LTYYGDLGLDNVDFSQVPEPVLGLLAPFGLAVAFGFRKRST